MIVRHLFKMDGSACGYNLVKSGLSIRQLALGSELNRTTVFLPGHAAIIERSRLLVYRAIISDVKVFCSIAMMVTLIPASAWCAGPALTPVQIRSALVEGMRYKSLNQFFQRKQISGYKHIRGTTVTLATGLSGTDIQANFFNEWWAVAAQGVAARQQMRQITPDQIESTGLLYVRVYAGAVGAVSTSKLNRRYGS